jgi:hypothetical protein
LDIWKTSVRAREQLSAKPIPYKEKRFRQRNRSVGTGVVFVTLERILKALYGLLIVLLQHGIQGLPCCPDRVSGAACLDIHLSQLGETAPVLVLAECDGFLKRGIADRGVILLILRGLARFS